MRRNLTLGQQIVVGFSLPILSLLLLGWLSYSSTRRLSQTGYWVDHTYEVLSELAHFLSFVEDVETRQRGFLLTENEEFLTEYRSAIAASERSYARLRTLTYDNAQQQRQLEILHPMVQERFSQLDLVVDRRKEEGLESTARAIAHGQGSRLMGEIHRQVAGMTAAERALLQQRADANAAAVRQMAISLAGGCLLTLLAVLVVGRFIIRSVKREIGANVAGVRDCGLELRADARQQAQDAQRLSAILAQLREHQTRLVAISQHNLERAHAASDTAGRVISAASEGEQALQRIHRAMAEVRLPIAELVDGLPRSAEQPGVPGDASNQPNQPTGEQDRLSPRAAPRETELASARSQALAPLIRSAAEALAASERQFQQAQASLQRITECIAEMAASTLSIELASREQATFIGRLNAATETVATSAADSDARARKIVTSANQLNALSRRLVRLIQPDRGSPGAPELGSSLAEKNTISQASDVGNEKGQ